MYTVAAMFPGHPNPRLANKDDPADLVVDIKDALDAKTQAAMCHISQHALFVRRASQEAGRALSVPEVLMQVESLHRAHPAVVTEEQDILAAALRDWLI
jgi:LmbE family N-acetylglucosaminyl deacetylase